MRAVHATASASASRSTRNFNVSSYFRSLWCLPARSPCRDARVPSHICRSSCHADDAIKRGYMTTSQPEDGCVPGMNGLVVVVGPVHSVDNRSLCRSWGESPARRPVDGGHLVGAECECQENQTVSVHRGMAGNPQICCSHPRRNGISPSYPQMWVTDPVAHPRRHHAGFFSRITMSDTQAVLVSVLLVRPEPRT